MAAGAEVARLIAVLEAQTAQFERDMRVAQSRLDSLDKTVDSTNKTMGRFGTAAKAAVAALGAREVLQFAKQTVGMAVAAEEAGAAFDTTFGVALPQASAFVEEFANKAGFAEYELQQLLAITGNIVQGLGATESESFALSQRMATLAGDVASFTNAAGGAPAVLLALQSAINGEREALKTYGLAVSEAEVQEKALQMTHKASASELTRLDKALATVEVAYGKAGKAVGDLDRTQDSTANTLRQLNAMWKEAQVEIGQALVPVLRTLLPVVKDSIPAFAGLIKIIAQMLNVLRPLIVALDKVLGLLDGMGSFVEDELRGQMAAARDAFMETRVGAEQMAAGVASALTGIRGAQAAAQGPLADYTQDWLAYAGGVDRGTDALNGFVAAQDDAFNPAKKLQKALEDQQGALDEVNRLTAAGAAGTDEYNAALLELFAAQVAVNSAQAAFDSSALLGDLRAVAGQLGLTSQQAEAFVHWLDELDGKTARVSIAAPSLPSMPGTPQRPPSGPGRLGFEFGPATGGGGGGTTVNQYVYGSVLTERELVDKIRDGLVQQGLSGG